MKKILGERFLIGMAFGFLCGISIGLMSSGSFMGLVQDGLVGSFAGGFVGLLFSQKAITRVRKFLETMGGF